MGMALSLHLFKSVDGQLSSTRQGLKDRWIYGSEYVFICGQGTAVFQIPSKAIIRWHPGLYLSAPRVRYR